MNMKWTSMRNRLIYGIIYLFGLLGGIVAYFFGKGRTKMHGKQAIIIGIIEVIIALVFTYMSDIYYIVFLIGIILGLLNIIII